MQMKGWDMSEMADRIAAALDRPADWDKKDLARAVLTAAREPTKAMICAVLDAHDANPRLTIAEDWRIMIDAALKD